MNFPIEIQQSKVKNALLTLASLVFVYISFWLIVLPKPPKMTNLFFGSLVVFFILGLFGALFSVLAAFVGVKDFLNKEPGLIISDKGITDSSTSGITNFFPWQEVLAIKELRVLTEKFVRIEVKQPQSHYYTKTNTIFDFFKNTKLGAKDPHQVLITVNGLKCSHKELKAMLERGFEKFVSKV